MEMPFVLGTLTVVLSLVAVAVWMFTNSTPTESIAQVLHDVEHPAPVAPIDGGRR
jgi:hypothetical protein